MIFKSEKRALRQEVEHLRDQLAETRRMLSCWESHNKTQYEQIQKLHYKMELLEAILKQLHIPVKLKDK